MSVIDVKLLRKNNCFQQADRCVSMSAGHEQWPVIPYIWRQNRTSCQWSCRRV